MWNCGDESGVKVIRKRTHFLKETVLSVYQYSENLVLLYYGASNLTTPAVTAFEAEQEIEPEASIQPLFRV
jgi:hypothetical protein